MEAGVNSKHFRILYYKYKDTVYFSIAVSALILVFNFFLYSFVVKPQYIIWQENNKKAEELRTKIGVLEKNNQVLLSLDPASLSSDLQLALVSLPAEQDYMGIMTAIASATSLSGVSLEDYSFRLGELIPTKPELLPVTLTVGYSGDTDSTQKFIQEIHQKIPVTNIKTIDISSENSEIILTFYSKKLDKFTLTEEKATSPLNPPSAAERELLSKLASWQQSLQVTQEFVPTASGSAELPVF